MVWKGTPSGDYLAPCLVKLIDEIDARAPKRNRTSDGSIGDRAHASRTSDHNPDSTGCVCALDVTDDPAHFDPDDLCEQLRQRRDPRIKYMISDRRICASYATSSRPAWTWGAYSGSNPHEQHAHISVLRERADDTTTWFPAEPQEDDDMNPIALVLLTYNAILGRNPESLAMINQQAEGIRKANDGGHSFVNAVANCDEAKAHRSQQKTAKVDRVRTDAEIIAVIKNALG